MESFIKKQVTVPFDEIFLDPNNPRLANPNAPGYENPDALFEDQRATEQMLESVYKPDSLVDAIVSQGWLPLDNIIVWKYPGYPNCSLVLEGNTRCLALRAIRAMYPKERKRLERMEKSGTKKYAAHDIKAQRDKVKQLATIIRDTKALQVVPINADSVEELQDKLPHILAVRHITGARGWGNYAEDLWLLQRYTDLYDQQFPEKDIRWEPAVIETVAAEASLSVTKTKRQLLAASAFSHFTGRFEDQLPEGEKFVPKDYYLFENIGKKPYIRNQFGFNVDDLHLAPDMEDVIFEWTFKYPRGRIADENPNVFYRHENILLWDQMKRYDDKQATGFAQRFDVTDPGSAPSMASVESDYLAHKSRQKPQQVLDGLIRRLKDIPAESLRTEGEFLKSQFKEIADQCEQFVTMIEAAEAVPAT